jgi:hypothetical protein
MVEIIRGSIVNVILWFQIYFCVNLAPSKMQVQVKFRPSISILSRFTTKKTHHPHSLSSFPLASTFFIKNPFLGHAVFHCDFSFVGVI